MNVGAARPTPPRGEAPGPQNQGAEHLDPKHRMWHLRSPSNRPGAEHLDPKHRMWHLRSPSNRPGAEPLDPKTKGRSTFHSYWGTPSLGGSKGAPPPLNPINWAYPSGILKGEALKAGVGTQCPLFNWFRGGVGAKKIK